ADKRILSGILMLLMFFMACKKQEGKGGKHSVTGKVIARKYNTSTQTYTSPAYPSQEEDVYIIYGDDVSYGDHQNANFDGSFEFKYLHKGKYKVYAYSKDSTNASPSGKIAVVKEFVIGHEKTTTVPDILILK
ncbi:MAG: hypothetical protein ACJ75J_01810, partial [Cytophagaceae bacterium]